jgi:hypothetical protein
MPRESGIADAESEIGLALAKYPMKGGLKGTRPASGSNSRHCSFSILTKRWLSPSSKTIVFTEAVPITTASTRSGLDQDKKP